MVVDTDLMGARTAPAMPARPQPKGEDGHVDPVGIHRETAGNSAVPSDGAYLEAEIRLEDHIKDQQQQEERQHDQEQPVPWEMATGQSCGSRPREFLVRRRSRVPARKST